MASVFMSYSHKDEVMRDRIETHLAQLKREGTIEVWHDRRIVPGGRLDESISAAAEVADVYLFLVSADFIASEYCYDIEMNRALDREKAGEAKVLPVLLHSCDWKSTPLARFNFTPADAQPIANFSYAEDAYHQVTEAVRRAVTERSAHHHLMRRDTPAVAAAPIARPSFSTSAPHPRSSNLAIRKVFTDRERNEFLEKGYEFIARYFEESLAELQRRNQGVEGSFRRNGPDAFTARAYRGGRQEAQCRIQLNGGMMGSGISLSDNPDSQNSFNEQLTVKTDDHGLTFGALGLSDYSGRDKGGLSYHGAAEFLWTHFIRRMKADGR